MKRYLKLVAISLFICSLPFIGRLEPSPGRRVESRSPSAGAARAAEPAPPVAGQRVLKPENRLRRLTVRTRSGARRYHLATTHRPGCYLVDGPARVSIYWRLPLVESGARVASLAVFRDESLIVVRRQSLGPARHDRLVGERTNPVSRAQRIVVSIPSGRHRVTAVPLDAPLALRVIRP